MCSTNEIQWSVWLRFDSLHSIACSFRIDHSLSWNIRFFLTLCIFIFIFIFSLIFELILKFIFIIFLFFFWFRKFNIQITRTKNIVLNLRSIYCFLMLKIVIHFSRQNYNLLFSIRAVIKFRLFYIVRHKVINEYFFFKLFLIKIDSCFDIMQASLLW